MLHVFVHLHFMRIKERKFHKGTYPLCVIFALLQVCNGGNDKRMRKREDEAAIRRDDALVSKSNLRKMNHSYIYDRDYGKFEYIAWTHIDY